MTPEKMGERLFDAFRRLRRGSTIGRLNNALQPERFMRGEESDTLVALLPGGRRVGALARIVDVESANLLRTLRALTVKGFVERRPDEIDHRATIVELTPGGRVVAEQAKARNDALVTELLARFPGRKREKLIATLEELSQAIAEISEELTDSSKRRLTNSHSAQPNDDGC